MKLSKELLSEIYEFVDANLKAKIENEVPEIKPNLEVGKWYKYTDSNIHLVNFTDIEKQIGYGFDTAGWNKKTAWTLDNLILATPEEVETAIKNECIRLGLAKGNAICLDTKQKTKIKKEGCFVYSHHYNYAFFAGVMVYNKGKFATPITEPTEKELLIEKLNELKEKANELENKINELKD